MNLMQRRHHYDQGCSLTYLDELKSRFPDVLRSERSLDVPETTMNSIDHLVA